MRLAVAQTQSTIGCLEQNVAGHVALVRLAARHAAELIVFPELSLTGYDPSLANDLSRSCQDACFSQFQTLCNSANLSICLGFPLRTRGLPRISSLVLRPFAEPVLYSKQYLHPDEEPFFESGTNARVTIHDNPAVALAICYELSVPEHADRAFAAGAEAYMASAAKTASGLEPASQRLSGIAKQHSAIVMLANCTGGSADFLCAGNSSAWGRSGQLLARLDGESEGVIVVDYRSQEVVTGVIP